MFFGSNKHSRTLPVGAVVSPSGFLVLLFLFLALYGEASPASPSERPVEWAAAIQDTTKPQDRPGGPSRRARALQKKLGIRDTSRTDADSVVLQALSSVPRDSSARLAHFRHVRTDAPIVNLLRPSPHPMYLKEPGLIQYVDEFDTSSSVYHIRRLVNGKETKISIPLTFEEYRDLRLKQALRRNWESLAQQYTVEGEKKQGLGDVFGSITNIEIPVPKNPLFSIFGKNQIRIQINGSVDIHGAFRNTKSDLVTSNPLDQSRSEPDFDQQVRVGVRGEIGDKLRIDADWDTERTFEYENQLKVRYTGYEDEIVQSVEAGNVSLQTNSSFISSSQALFGIKAGFQFGPLKLTTIASQKRGQIKELSVSGGGRPTPFEKKPYEYSRDHYFVDTVYRSIYDNAFRERPPTYDTRYQILDIEVWVTRVGIIQDPNDRDAVTFISADTVQKYQNDPAARTIEFPANPGVTEVSRFMKLVQGADYTFDPYLGYISLNRSLQPEQVIAVAYTLPSPIGDVGTFESKDTSKTTRLILKLVRPRNLQSNMKPAWDLMLKNMYSLGGRGLKKEGFELAIKYQLPGQEPVTALNVSALSTPKSFDLLPMFRLDSYNESGQQQPDSKFDFEPGITINVDRGELIFPRLEPFAKNITEFFLEQFSPTTADQRAEVIAAADSFVIREVYDTTYNGAQNAQKNRFVISGTIVSAIASTYNLGFNVVEGSVDVVVDGQSAAPSVDFTVDYLTGTVVIRNQSFLVPGRTVQIKYEANDLFQLASKSLLGARGEYAVSKSTGLGFTVMNLNQQTLSDKVRLGEEPISNTIMGIDGGTSFELDFLTRAMNALPGIRTNAPSSLSFRGEAAYMLPDPNTRKSNITQDRSQGIAYIDDFEGSRRTIPLGVHYGIWRDASAPAYIDGLDPVQPQNGHIDLNNASIRQALIPDSSKMGFKAKLTWFNVQPSDVFIQDIWPKRETRAGQDLVTVLDLFYRPRSRGAYNYSLTLRDSLFAQPAKGWAGVMHPLSTTATNLVDENITFIEMWIRVGKIRPGARMNINLGAISEDAIPNGLLDSEDGLGGTIKTGLIRDDRQDVGLDGFNDDEERARFSEFLSLYPEFSADPSADNYVAELRGSLNPEDYLGARGTDGNKRGLAEGGQFPDTEDLNSNNVVDRSNSYFEYEIPLDTTSPGFRQYVTGGEGNGWHQIRVPVREHTRKIGDPSLTNIESIRLWMTGADDDVSVRITEFNLVGNQWEPLNRDDKDFRISNVNIEENLYYTSPPGVQRPVDRTQPDRIIAGNEQSLALIITNLRDGESKQAIKRYVARPLDLFSYRTMKLFVHGDDRPGTVMNYVDTTNYDVEFFFRFGSDSLNYYEYRSPLRPGWHADNEITIRFADVTAIKLGRDSAGILTAPIPVPGGSDGAVYRVLGNPTLTTVRYLAVGVANPPGKGSSVVNGEVWVNELRLTDVDDTPGWAYRFDTSVKFADIASVAIGLSQRDPYFHGLENRFGTRNTDRNWSINSSLSMDKFLPDDWKGSQLTLTYSHVEAMQNPRYMPGTDILVDEAVHRTSEIARSQGESEDQVRRTAESIREQSRSLTVTETYSLPTIRVIVPSSSWYVAETINRMTLGYSFTNARRRNPTTEFFQQWSWNFRFGYNLQFSPQSFVQPFGDLGDFFLFSPWKSLKFFYLPRTVSVGGGLARSQVHERVRNQAQKKPVGRNFGATRQMSFSWQLVEGGILNPGIDYNLDITSSLVHLELDKFGRQKSMMEILGDMFGGEKLIDFGIDQTYGQTISLGTRIVVPPVLKFDKIFTPTFRYSSRYDWQNNLQAGALGRNAGRNVSLNSSVDVNLKVIAEEIWPRRSAAPQTSDTVASMGDRFDQLTRVLFKAPFFDWDRLSFNFTHANTARNSGVLGRPGFLNLFGRVPFLQESLTDHGPSMLYQLGLATDPHGRVVVRTKGAFPFITGSTVPGLRAPLGNLSDVYSQSNNINMRTSRALWEGARIDLTWTLGWTYNLNRTIQTDSLGVPRELSRTVSGDVSRTFITFPGTSLFKIFKTGIEEVNTRFQLLKGNRIDPRSDDIKLTQAFEEGMEALPLGTKLISALMPRPNWSFRWDGLEKFSLFSGFTQRVTLDHAYTSTFRRRWKLTPTGGEVTESENVTYGFSPLIGLSMTFKELGKGSLTGNFRYAVTTSYDLAPTVQNITESNTTDITISGNYSQRGFEFPFFGLSLSNDLDISFSYSYSKNNRRVFDMKKDFKKDGDPLEGTVRTTFEPRIRYILSSRVTASIYYKYTKLKPDEGGSRIPGSTINEGGLDIRVQIS